MRRDKVLGFGWHFLPNASSNSTRTPRLFDWTDDPREATADVAVYMGVAIADGIGVPGRKIAWVLESPDISRSQKTTPFIEEHLDEVVASYEVVLTSDRDFCKRHPKIVYHPAAANLPWIPESQYALYKKSKLCSMFASGKTMVAGHLYRQQVAARLKDTLDLFGGACDSPRIGGSGAHPDKSEGIIPYMFQVVLENAKVDFYYTEKITDCFATGTVPIYWGSSCIGELFDTEGILVFDDTFSVDALSADLYYEMMPAIRNNFRLVQELEGTDDLLYRRYLTGEASVGPWKPNTRETACRASPIRRHQPTVPWLPWDPERIAAASRTVPATDAERVRVAASGQGQNVRTLAEVPTDHVSVREIASTLHSPRCAQSSALEAWPPQLTRAFLVHVPDAFIGDGVVFDRDRYYGMDRWWLGRSAKLYTGTREVRHIEAAVSIAAWGGEAFQHFVIDALPALGAVIDLLETPELAHVRIVSHDEPDRAARWFWQRLRLQDRIVAKPRNRSSALVVHADLVLFPQFEPNLNQLGLYPRGTLRPIQRRLGTLEPSSQDLVVYLQRNGPRSVENEDALLSRVESVIGGSGLSLHIFRGATDPGAAADLMRRARVVLGPHGGAFANLVFAQPDTGVIEFVPLQRLLRQQARDPLTMYYGLAQAAGLDYWFVEPDRFEHDAPGMIVDTNAVVTALRHMLEGR